ncbi:hypothetical protein ACQY0O_007948 [Thecaphora frezii]
MSASPFISENSIWSNAAVSSPGPRSHSPQMPGSMFIGGAVIQDVAKPASSERSDIPRLGSHPLPNRPAQSQSQSQSQPQSHTPRTASALSFRSNASVEDHTRSLDSQPFKQGPGPGAIGGHRVPSRDLNTQLSRSNSLAASVHSFRSANSASPSVSMLPNPVGDLNVPISAGKHLFQRQNSTGGGPVGSPTSNSFQAASPGLGAGTGAHPNRDASASGETEFGTPRLFLEGQHVFGSDETIPPMDVGWDLGRSASLRSSSAVGGGLGGQGPGKPRPKSWIQPPTSGSSLAHGDRAVSQPRRSGSGDVKMERAASVGASSPKPPTGFGESQPADAAQGYPFPTATPQSAAQRSTNLRLRYGNDSGDENHDQPLTGSPVESSDALHSANLSINSAQQGRGSLARGGGSPGLTPNNFGTASGRGTPTLNPPRNLNLVGGLLSPTAATVGGMGPMPMLAPPGSPGFAQRSDQQAAAAGANSNAPSSSFDEQLRASPLFNDLTERLLRAELGMKDFSRQVSGISRNVSLLLERTKGLPPASLAGGNNQPAQNIVGGHGASHDEVRALNSQVAALASSVSHLLSLQGSGASAAGGRSMSQLAGLGIGPAPFLGTPQLGGPGGGGSAIERSGSPRVGTLPGGQLGPLPGIGALENVRGLSPRPGAGGRGWTSSSANSNVSANPNAAAVKEANDARWSVLGAPNARKDGAPANLSLNPGLGLGPGTPTLEDLPRDGSSLAPGTGFTQPNAIVSKWENLNLHPDLLRSILKYGLGPPNKIQQRALPFLLRGSDIIAQAPPTQERIASYVIPALQLVLNVGRENAAGGMGPVAGLPGFNGRLHLPNNGGAFPPPTRGPVALIVSTTVDQATQAQRMALGLGSSLGIRVHIAAAGGIEVQQEAQAVAQNWPHIVVGTPQKMSDLFTYLTNNASSLPGLGNGVPPISTAEVRLVVLDEVDQLIARNLADHVSSLLRVLPQPAAPAKLNIGAKSPGLPPSSSNGIPNFTEAPPSAEPASVDRQMALFSNTVPQDVLNFAQSIHLRESVRVLVRRDGGSALPGGANAGSTGTSSAIAGGPNGGAGGVATASGFLPARPGHGRDATQPSNALGAHPVNSSINPLSDPVIAALKGLRQYYLYVAVTSNGGGSSGSGGGHLSPNPGMGPQAANEMKLDLITDLMEDIEFGQAVVYCANNMTLEAIIYKLAAKGVEAVGLSRDMNSYTRQQTLARFRSPTSQFGTGAMVSTPTFSQPAGFAAVSGGGRTRKVLVVCDMAVNPKDVHQVPLVVFYDMPRSVDDYKEKIACASAGALARPGVCINVVTASGGPRGDVEMLRTLECHLGCKMAELPIDAKQILNF